MGRPCLQWPGLRLLRVNNHRHSLRVYRHPLYQGCCASGSITLQSRSFGQGSSRAIGLGDERLFIRSEEVATAIHYNQPVVALETTIYTHGFPYPQNVELALELEAVVRSNGGVPATIGILEGVARIGLDKEQLIAIACSASEPETMKVSRRDLPYILGLVSYRN
jgi:pseudouridine-5'-phosphate glycosidase/pseudouridine kinase